MSSSRCDSHNGEIRTAICGHGAHGRMYRTSLSANQVSPVSGPWYVICDRDRCTTDARLVILVPGTTTSAFDVIDARLHEGNRGKISMGNLSEISRREEGGHCASVQPFARGAERPREALPNLQRSRGGPALLSKRRSNAPERTHAPIATRTRWIRDGSAILNYLPCTVMARRRD